MNQNPFACLDNRQIMLGRISSEFEANLNANDMHFSQFTHFHLSSKINDMILHFILLRQWDFVRPIYGPYYGFGLGLGRKVKIIMDYGKNLSLCCKCFRVSILNEVGMETGV